MSKKKWILLSAVSVIVVSLMGSVTYAWFSAQASAAVGANADENGIDGGLVAGHVDILFSARSYSSSRDGSIVYDPSTGQPVSDPTTVKRPLIIYPGDLVDFNGNSVSGAISHIEYTLENTSGTDIIARTNHQGVFDISMNNPNNATEGGTTGRINLLVYKLKRQVGSPPDNNSDYNWFYLAGSPTGIADFLYVDKKALDLELFIPYLIKDNVPENAKTSSGALYPPGVRYNYSKFYAEYGIRSDMTSTGLTVSGKITATDSRIRWASGVDSDEVAGEYIYFYMPKQTSVTVTFDLEIPDMSFSIMNPELFDNRFQYAVFLLNLASACGKQPVETDPDGNPLFEAYGVQAIDMAVADFFGEDAYNSLIGKLPIKSVSK